VALFARPLTDAERPVRLVWLTIVVVKPVDVDTRTLYDVAPVTVFQLRVGKIATPVLPLEGNASVGAPGAATIVVKLHTFDHALVSPVFIAFASQ
jgi:hypothetical protein